MGLNVKDIQIWQVLNSPHIGGGEKLAFAINDYLTNHTNIKSGLIVPDKGDTIQHAKTLNTPCETYRFDALSGDSAFSTAIENIRLALTRWNSQAIFHFHSPFVYGSARLLRKLTGLRSIVHIHLDYSKHQLQWPLRDCPTAVIGCANYVLHNVESTLSQHPTQPKTFTVLNAINIERFKPKAQKVEPHTNPVIIMLANIAPHKGQHTAIAALKKLAEKGIAAELWLAGEERGSNNHTNQLQQMAAELGITEQVKFLGFRSDINALLWQSDYLVLPSTNEGLPLSLLEAQAAGVITLASPTAGVPELISDGYNGFLIDADNPDGYAKCIANMITHPEQKQKIRENAWNQLQLNHDMTHYFEQVTAIYERLFADT